MTTLPSVLRSCLPGAALALVAAGLATAAAAQTANPVAQAPVAAVSAPAVPLPTPNPLVGYDYSKVEKLLAGRQYAAALQAADAHLQNRPRDPQMRLLKSRTLQAQGRHDEALALLQSLTQEFPEIPEPHNNLAVMYAQRGQIEPARQALETALRLNPAYGIAHENLGDIYRRMAHNSYQRALALQPGNSALRAKAAATAR